MYEFPLASMPILCPTSLPLPPASFAESTLPLIVIYNKGNTGVGIRLILDYFTGLNK